MLNFLGSIQHGIIPKKNITINTLLGVLATDTEEEPSALIELLDVPSGEEGVV